MPELHIRKKNGNSESRDIEGIAGLRAVIQPLSGKDEVSPDGLEWTQKRRIKDIATLWARLSGDPKSSESEVSPGGPSPEAEKPVTRTPVHVVQTRNPRGADSRIDDLDRKVTALTEGEALRNLAEGLSKEAIDGLGRRVVDEIEKLQVILRNYQQVKKAVEDEWTAQEALIERYSPGRARVLEQERDALQTEIRRLIETGREKEARIDSLERDLRGFREGRTESDLEEMKRREQSLIEKELDLLARLELQDENRNLQERLIRLESMRDRYERIQEGVRADELAKAESQRLRSEKESLEDENGSLKADLSRRISALHDLRRSHQAVKDRLQKLEDTLESERAQHEDLRSKAEQVDRAIEVGNQRERALTQRESELTRVNGEILQSAQKRLEHAFQSRWNARSQEEALELDRARQRISVLEDLVEKLKEEQQRFQEERLQKTLELADLEAQLKDGKRALEDTKGRVEQASRLLRDYQAELADTSGQHELMRRELEAERAEARLVVSEELRQAAAELQEHRYQVVGLAGAKASLEGDKASLEASIEKLKEDGKAILDPTQRTVSIQESVLPTLPSISDCDGMSEGAWLEGVAQRIERSGFYYPRRLLESFHTSLKISSWSPLTALAGVSGTGKSELPRLYGKCGGIHFLRVPVQPNWDSPQDLFGFFNYMDGRYIATEFLRALVQSSQSEGHRDQMLIVLLDEMNLARVEQYFSEILSKLGSVQDRDQDNCEWFEVQIGLGQTKRIELRRNVLYVGTMNEDETTHILSDKVLDRGNVLSFPRPKRLESRGRVGIEEALEALPARQWAAWIREPAEILDAKGCRNDIREALQRVNHGLSMVNRAIGHRVLQAVEAYVANHPSTSATDDGWKRAFGDQMAQRVMPKLRGLENDGDNAERCLEIVRNILDDHARDLLEDFDHARDPQRSRTFRWDSSEYLNF